MGVAASKIKGMSGPEVTDLICSLSDTLIYFRFTAFSIQQHRVAESKTLPKNDDDYGFGTNCDHNF